MSPDTSRRTRLPGLETNLPPGKTCSACFLFGECRKVGAAEQDDERCFFSSNGFREIDPVTQRELDKMKPESDPCGRCIYKRQWLEFLSWVRQFKKETLETPVNTEHAGRGASVYNWRSWFLRQIKAGLGVPPEGWQ